MKKGRGAGEKEGGGGGEKKEKKIPPPPLKERVITKRSDRWAQKINKSHPNTGSNRFQILMSVCYPFSEMAVSEGN